MTQAATVDLFDPDDTLARRASLGDDVAFEVLVGRYQNKVYRLAWRMARNPSDAEEITQETFLHAYRGITSFQAASKFGTWLYRIAINATLMQKRTARRRPTESIEELHSSIADGGSPRWCDSGAVALADELLERKQLAMQIRRALERLDEAHRAAFVLRDLEELSAGEAAAILCISPDAVRQRAHRARLMLREYLSGLAAS